MSASVSIYALIDPRTGLVRYVGKSKNVDLRVRYGHLGAELKNARLHKTNWLRQLAELQLQPIVQILEVTDESSWQERERYWIAHYRSIGASLTNMTEGGDGGCIGHSESTRLKMSQSRLGKLRDPQTVQKMREANKGKAPSPSCEKARIDAITGKRAHPNTVNALATKNAGNKYRAKHLYVAIDPQGMRHFVGISLAEFCKEQSLDQVRMRSLAGGDPLRKSHKGWTCYARSLFPRGARVPELANLKE